MNTNPCDKLILNAEGQRGDAEICIKMLNEAFDEKDGAAVEEALYKARPAEGFSNKFSGIFCKLLQADWHFRHEDIAFLLQGIRDPATVDCLYEAAELQFDHLAYDDSYQFARKCIKAISAIDNDNAIVKLQKLSQSNILDIRGYAIKELKYKGLW